MNPTEGSKDRFTHLLEAYGRQMAAEGETRGRAEGQRSLLTKLFRLKFDWISPCARRRLARANEEQLEDWADRLLSADAYSAEFDHLYHANPITCTA